MKTEPNHKAIALLDEWLNDTSGYDEKAWHEVKKTIDENRLSDRKIYEN